MQNYVQITETEDIDL